MAGLNSKQGGTCVCRRQAQTVRQLLSGAVRPTARSSRRAAVATKCIYSPNSDVGRREALERRFALALSCTERQVASDLLGVAGSFNQSPFSAPRRLRIAVDVDEGKSWHQARCWLS